MATINYHDKPVHYRVLFADPALPYGAYELTRRSRRVYHYTWLVIDRTSGLMFVATQGGLLPCQINAPKFECNNSSGNDFARHSGSMSDARTSGMKPSFHCACGPQHQAERREQTVR
jgi:hypothetical protein